MDRDKPNLGRLVRAEIALGNFLRKVSRLAVDKTGSYEDGLTIKISKIRRLWQAQIQTRAKFVKEEAAQYAEFVSERFTPTFDKARKIIGLKLETYHIVETMQFFKKRIRKLSYHQKSFLVQSAVVSILILPMISVSYLGNPVTNGVNNYGSVGILKTLADADKLRQRYALTPSRGATALADTTTSAPANVDTTTPPPPAPAPVDENLPPELSQNTQNIEQTLLQRFDAFRTYIYQQYGVALEIKSGWRSYEEQAQLFASLPPGYANPPGSSQHERGNAIDYTPFTAEYNQHLAQFGLKLPFPGKENWHIEIVEPH